MRWAGAPAPKHAYSPFDQPAVAAASALTPADYTGTKVLIRLKPEALEARKAKVAEPA